MVNISIETQGQTEQRLIEVLRRSSCDFYNESYAFEEFGLDRFPGDALPDALAFVRDDECWSQLRPSEDENKELFAIWRFHFPENVDNSGFVGWLANRFKAALGSGVFVICGQNSRNGGIYDYWGCPLSLRDDAFKLLMELGAKPVGLG